ncbi:MAG: PAS domain-containing protein [Oscillospiraceae bacterium]
MEFYQYFKSIIDQDEQSVVICDTNHTIIYMNPAAISNYSKSGGKALVGKSVFECHNNDSKDKIEKVVEWFKKDISNNKIFTFHNEKHNRDVYMVALRDQGGRLIGYYEKHECRDSETDKKYNLI